MGFAKRGWMNVECDGAKWEKVVYLYDFAHKYKRRRMGGQAILPHYQIQRPIFHITSFFLSPLSSSISLLSSCTNHFFTISKLISALNSREEIYFFKKKIKKNSLPNIFNHHFLLWIPEISYTQKYPQKKNHTFFFVGSKTLS